MRHVSVGESVLRGAVYGGQAQSVAQGMLDDARLDSVAMWSGLGEYYDTALNRANVVHFDIRRLLSLQLTPDTTDTKFISDFRDCLQRLRKNNARLSDDTDTLRAFLLVAIQDDNFEIVRDSIVHKPDIGKDTILTELCECETSLIMKDQASYIGDDGTTLSLGYSHRVQQTQFPGTHDRPVENAASSSQKWSIPKFPDSWRSGFGVSLSSYVCRGIWMPTRAAPRPSYPRSSSAILVESFTQSSGKSKGGKHKSPPNDSTSASSAPNGDGAATSGDRNGSDIARKRIRLQKSRRIVTERSA